MGDDFNHSVATQLMLVSHVTMANDTANVVLPDYIHATRSY